MSDERDEPMQAASNDPELEAFLARARHALRSLDDAEPERAARIEAAVWQAIEADGLGASAAARGPWYARVRTRFAHSPMLRLAAAVLVAQFLVLPVLAWVVLSRPDPPQLELRFLPAESSPFAEEAGEVEDEADAIPSIERPDPGRFENRARLDLLRRARSTPPPDPVALAGLEGGSRSLGELVLGRLYGSLPGGEDLAPPEPVAGLGDAERSALLEWWLDAWMRSRGVRPAAAFVPRELLAPALPRSGSQLERALLAGSLRRAAAYGCVVPGTSEPAEHGVHASDPRAWLRALRDARPELDGAGLAGDRGWRALFDWADSTH